MLAAICGGCTRSVAMVRRGEERRTKSLSSRETLLISRGNSSVLDCSPLCSTCSGSTMSWMGDERKYQSGQKLAIFRSGSKLCPPEYAPFTSSLFSGRVGSAKDGEVKEREGEWSQIS